VKPNAETNLNQEVRRLTFLLGLTERLQPATDLGEIGQFALSYLVETMGAAFGDIKVISGTGENRQATMITNQVSSRFIATYGETVKEMEYILSQGIPYGQGLLWQVIETGEPLFVEDYANHPQAVEGFRHPGIGQLGIFPIPGANGRIIGVLTLESRSNEKLQEAIQQDMLVAACRTLGVAIQRTQAEEELRQANENLEKASRMKSEFLASMSHELRTPLNSIIGFADLLRRQVGNSLDPRQLKHIEAIEKSGQHLLQLINEILDLSKIEAGKAELQFEAVEIHKLCNQALKMVHPRAEKKHLALSLEIDYRLQNAWLDERRVRQILINLLSNAVKFTPEQGKIKLTARLAYGNELLGQQRLDCSPVNADTPFLCLEVSDTGIGIPQDKQHLLFKPFQQIDSSLTRRHEGTGLGLSLVKRLTELHCGTISLESEESQGSVFRVWLPLTEIRQELKPTIASSKPKTSSTDSLKSVKHKTKTKRILLVEDHAFNQMLITEMLELEGYEVELIYDGATMLNLVQSPVKKSQLLPDLILMDIQLPEVDGLEIIRQMRTKKYWQDLPIIAVTAMAMPGDREQCLNAGANDYLSKPLNFDKLIDKIRNLLKT
jgi:two-component system, sensor histidine kinase